MIYIALLLLLVVGAVIPKLYFYLQRNRARDFQRERKPALFYVNPRPGRVTIRQPIKKSLRRAAWMIAQNNPRVSESIREYCEVMGIDNSHYYVDTYRLQDMTGSKIRRLLLRTREKLSGAYRFRMSIRTDSKRRSIHINYLLKMAKGRRTRSLKRLIKFIRKEGEVDPNENY